MKKFEYKITAIPMSNGAYNATLKRKETLYMSPEQYEATLNDDMGSQGWELCGQIRGCWIFKREKL